MCPGCGYFLMEKDRRQVSGSGSMRRYRGLFIAIAIFLILLFLFPAISLFF